MADTNPIKKKRVRNLDEFHRWAKEIYPTSPELISTLNRPTVYPCVAVVFTRIEKSNYYHQVTFVSIDDLNSSR